MRGSCDPVGYRMAHGWRYTNPSLASALLGVYYRHASVLLYGLPARLFILPITILSGSCIFYYICFPLYFCRFCIVFVFKLWLELCREMFL